MFLYIIYLTFDNKPMLQLSFYPSFIRCKFQCRTSCRIIPNYFTWDEGLTFTKLYRPLIRN